MQPLSRISLLGRNISSFEEKESVPSLLFLGPEVHRNHQSSCCGVTWLFFPLTEL